MRFKTKLSTKQYSSVFYFILGIFFLYVVVYGETENKIFFLELVAGIMIVVSIMNFFDGFSKRRIIRTSANHKNYDGGGGERLIAEFFEKRKIIFELHPKLKVPKTVLGFIDVPFRRIILTPDFFLPEYDIYVEFWGMIDNEKYKENIFKPKMKIYKSNLIDMISLYPRNLENLERDFHQKLLEIVRDREGNSKEWR